MVTLNDDDAKPSVTNSYPCWHGRSFPFEAIALQILPTREKEARLAGTDDGSDCTADKETVVVYVST